MATRLVQQRLIPAELDTGFRGQTRWVQNYFKDGKYIKGAFAAAISAGTLPLKVAASAGRLFSNSAYNVFDRDLNAVKAHIGISDANPASNLNFTQVKKVYDLANLQFRATGDRVKNLDAVCTQTEYSLSKNAHETSKKRGTEDRFFGFEAHKLVNPSEAPTAGEFFAAKKELQTSIEKQIRVEHKYTLQQGNSASSINRRAYILESILNFAYDFGLAGKFLTALIGERNQIAAEEGTAPAETFFRSALQLGIDNGLLSPTDPRLYQGAVIATATAALEQPKGQNRDAIIESIFQALNEAGLLDAGSQARFTSDVREVIASVEGGLIESPSVLAGTNAFMNRGNGKTGASAANGAPGAGSDESWLTKWIRKRETNKAEELRLQAVDQKTADAELSEYLKNLKALIDAQEGLIVQDTELNKLLDMVAQNPLSNLEKLPKKDLIGLIELLHNGVVDPRKGLLEQLDASIKQRKETIAEQQTLVVQLTEQCKDRPANFKKASKGQRSLAEKLEGVVKKNKSQIGDLDKRAVKLTNDINGTRAKVQQAADKERAELFPSREGEEDLPIIGGKPPEAPKKSGGFARLFKSKQEEAPQVEGAPDDAAQFPPLPAQPLEPIPPKKGWIW